MHGVACSYWKQNNGGNKRLKVTENFQSTVVKSSFIEMSNHPIERERGKLKTWATFSCQFLSDKSGIFFMCPRKVADSCWNTCSFPCTSLTQKHNKWKCSDKILLLHQHSFRFKSFVNSSLRVSKVQTVLQNSEKPTMTFVPAQNKLSGAYVSRPIKSMLIMIIIANKKVQGLCIIDFQACNSYFMKD